MKNIQLPFFTSMFVLFFLVISCNDKRIDTSFGTTILDTMSNDKLQSNTRASIEFENGEKTITFTVIYDGSLRYMAYNNESDFKALLEAYDLQMERPFEIDENNKGIILVASSKLDSPVEIGKRISMVNEVKMVEVGNVSITKEKEVIL